MKPKQNPYNFQSIEKLREFLTSKYPNIEIAVYVRDFSNSPLATTAMGVSATCEFTSTEAALRFYRESDTPEVNKWDIDQKNAVNKPILYKPGKKEIPGHHINHNIEEDIMKRNAMTFEVTMNSNGEFILNLDEKGFNSTFINFETPPDRK